MSNGGNRNGSGRGPSESGVAEKLRRIRERRAQRQAQPPGPATGIPDRPDAETYDDDDGDEKTAAFNIDDMGDLLAEDDDDDGNAATAAFDIGDMAATFATRNAAALKARASEVIDDDDDDGDEKTAAFNIEDMGDLLADAPPTPRGGRASAAVDDHADDDGDESTAAFAVDDLADLMGDRPSRMAAAASAAAGPVPRGSRSSSRADARRAPEPDPEPEPEDEGPDRTMMVDIDSVPGLPSLNSNADAGPPQLKVVEGAEVGRTYDITRDLMLVGRGLDADVVIHDASTSRRHFNIVRTTSGWKLVDLGSGNGTRVDGSRVQEIALQEGMRIECGTTALTWVAGGSDADDDDDEPEKTRLGDMAALEIDPQWAGRSGVPEEDSIGTNTSAEGQVVEGTLSAVHPAAGGGGKGKLVALILGGLVLLGGAFVAVDKFANLGIIFKKEKTTNNSGSSGEGTEVAENGENTENGEGEGPGVKTGGTTGTEAGGTKVDVDALITKGKAAIGDQRWLSAQASFNAALEADDDAAAAEDGLKVASRALSAWQSRVNGEIALASRDYTKANRLFTAVPGDSPYAKGIDTFKALMTPALLADHIAASRSAEDKGDLKGAMAAVERALKLAPSDNDAKALKLAYETATGPNADKLVDADGNVKSTNAPRKDLSPGMTAYAGGQYAQAIDFFDGIVFGEASSRDKAKASAMGQAISKIEAALRAAQNDAAGGQDANAIANLWKAIKYDAVVGGAQRPSIQQKLAGVYAKQASAAKGIDSAALARWTLALDPNNATAKGIQTKASESAANRLEQAADLKGDAPDKALSFVMEALRVADPKSETFGAAKKLLAALLGG